jgi:hypothetical protein
MPDKEAISGNSEAEKVPVKGVAIINMVVNKVIQIIGFNYLVYIQR